MLKDHLLVEYIDFFTHQHLRWERCKGASNQSDFLDRQLSVLVSETSVHEDVKEAMADEDSLGKFALHSARLICLLLFDERGVLEFADHDEDVEGDAAQL